MLPVPAVLGIPLVVGVVPTVPSALPSLSASVPPDSITSGIPSLSESKSKWFGIPSPSASLPSPQLRKTPKATACLPPASTTVVIEVAPSE